MKNEIMIDGELYKKVPAKNFTMTTVIYCNICGKKGTVGKFITSRRNIDHYAVGFNKHPECDLPGESV